MFPALQRFFEAVECRTQAELAEFLGIKQSSISDAKKKTIPPDWLLTALRKKESDRMGYSPGKAPVCCNPAMGWEWLSPCMYPFWK